MRVFLLFFLAACTPLPAIATGVCGNAVLDDDEDCDHLVDDPADPLVCQACRFVCSDRAVCPTGWSCGLDQVCRPPAGRFVAGTPVRLPTSFVELADFNGDRLLDLVG